MVTGLGVTMKHIGPPGKVQPFRMLSSRNYPVEGISPVKRFYNTLMGRNIFNAVRL